MVEKYNYDIVFYSAKILNSSAVVLERTALYETFSELSVADSIGYTNKYFDNVRKSNKIDE